MLKVLPPELAQAVSTERFRQEIRLAARLQHPHKAVTGYQYVADAWRHADAVVQPYVRDARSELERLTAERAP